MEIKEAKAIVKAVSKKEVPFMYNKKMNLLYKEGYEKEHGRELVVIPLPIAVCIMDIYERLDRIEEAIKVNDGVIKIAREQQEYDRAEVDRMMRK